MSWAGHITFVRIQLEVQPARKRRSTSQQLPSKRDVPKNGWFSPQLYHFLARRKTSLPLFVLVSKIKNKKLTHHTGFCEDEIKLYPVLKCVLV